MLERLYLRDAPPDPFTSRALAKQADALQVVDAPEASVAKAALAALNWDADGVNYWVDNALALDSSVHTLTNSAVSVRYANLFHREASLLAQAARLAPVDPIVMTAYLDALLYCGQLETAAQVYRAAIALGTDIDAHVRDTSLFHAGVSDLGIAPERLAFEVDAAVEILTSSRRRVRELYAEVDRDQDGGRTLVLRFAFHGDLADELRLEAALAELLAERPGWNPVKLSIELRGIAENVDISV